MVPCLFTENVLWLWFLYVKIAYLPWVGWLKRAWLFLQVLNNRFSSSFPVCSNISHSINLVNSKQPILVLDFVMQWLKRKGGQGKEDTLHPQNSEKVLLSLDCWKSFYYKSLLWHVTFHSIIKSKYKLPQLFHTDYYIYQNCLCKMVLCSSRHVLVFPVCCLVIFCHKHCGNECDKWRKKAHNGTCTVNENTKIQKLFLLLKG